MYEKTVLQACEFCMSKNSTWIEAQGYPYIRKLNKRIQESFNRYCYADLNASIKAKHENVKIYNFMIPHLHKLVVGWTREVTTLENKKLRKKKTIIIVPLISVRQ